MTGNTMPILPILLCLLIASPPAGAQDVVPEELLSKTWSAVWLGSPDAERTAYGVYHFRRSFDLNVRPERFVVHVSADNRYRLYVNGIEACEGPSRGDPEHWRFESVDIAPLLKDGKNVIAALVWNSGEHLPMAQMTRATAFLLQGEGDAGRLVDTSPATWRVLRNEAFSPLESSWNGLKGAPDTQGQYKVIGPGDRIDGVKYPWGWMDPDYDDSAWSAAVTLGRRATPRGIRDGGSLWNLMPRPIPAMEKRPEAPARIRRAEGVRADDGFLNGGAPLVVPPNTKAVLLLDQGFLTNVYPELTVSGGAGSLVRLTWAEALLDSAGEKRDRNRIEGMHILGHYDEFLPDGGERRSFSTLWFRTFRYLQLDIVTGGEPLSLLSIGNTFTGYPFELRAKFDSDDPSLAEIWDVSWRTARLCAGENYFDCPFYEQLQYVGDTRIQALISLYLSGDDRLMRQAIRHFDDSRIPEGLTESRYPSYVSQIIPPYSLFWVVMVHDYWMHRHDPVFVESFLPGIRGVLEWFEKRLGPDGLPGPLEWWNFVDWATQYGYGVPPGAEEGGSAVIALQYAYTLRCAAELFLNFGHDVEALRCRALADRVGRAVMAACWSEERMMLAETPDRKLFSQHTNSMAILLDLVTGEEAVGLFRRITTDDNIIACTFYYRFYLLEAMHRIGLAGEFIGMLEPWRDMLAIGLTTFAENPEPTRSDCHAWSAGPAWGLLSTVCGIRPSAPGFGAVRIEPAPGGLNRVNASMPHPYGMISVSLARKARGGLTAAVTLPEGLYGAFVWEGVQYALEPGETKIEVPSRK